MKKIVLDFFFFFLKENKSAVESNISGSLDQLSRVRKEQEHLCTYLPLEEDQTTIWDC